MAWWKRRKQEENPVEEVDTDQDVIPLSSLTGRYMDLSMITGKQVTLFHVEELNTWYVRIGEEEWHGATQAEAIRNAEEGIRK
jgi:hypothetical protein